MKVVKTHILVTVLHEQEHDVGSWSLEEIYGDMNEGCIVGTIQHLGSLPVSPECLSDELAAVGNDGDFFSELETSAGSVRDEDFDYNLLIGREVRLKQDKELFSQSLIVPIGSVGKISSIMEDSITVTLDRYYPELRHWDNELIWSRDDETFVGAVLHKGIVAAFLDQVELV